MRAWLESAAIDGRLPNVMFGIRVGPAVMRACEDRGWSFRNDPEPWPNSDDVAWYLTTAGALRVGRMSLAIRLEAPPAGMVSRRSRRHRVHALPYHITREGALGVLRAATRYVEADQALSSGGTLEEVDAAITSLKKSLKQLRQPPTVLNLDV